MLVLARRKAESIVLLHQGTGELIEITPTQIQQNQVRIGIEAKQHWKIIRSELIEEEAAKAA